MAIFRRRSSSGGGGAGARGRTGRRAAVASRIDSIRDAFAAGRVRRGWQGFVRWLGFTTSGLIALGAGVVLYVFGRIIGGLPVLLIAYGFGILLVASIFLARRRLNMEGERSGLYARAQQGDRLNVEVVLRAKRSVSTFILEERVPEKLGRPVRVPIARLPAGAAVSHKYSIRCARRGVYEIGPLVAITSDPLGLTQRENKVAEKFELLVHPRIEEVSDRPLTRQFEDPPIRPPVSKPFPTGFEFYGMREYKPGDDLRRIVWRASARMGKLMVREAEQGITDRITIILDTDRGTHSRDGEYSESFETGVSAAASLATRHLRDGYELRLEGNAGAVARPTRGQGGILPVLDSLTRVEMSREPLEGAIKRLLGNSQRDAHNILITPHLTTKEAAQLRLLLQTGVSLLVVALLWREDSDETLNAAAALGCQVAAVNPGQDLASALYHDIGAGSR
jgi:uncharacterized protein (DUF58 family)